MKEFKHVTLPVITILCVLMITTLADKGELDWLTKTIHLKGDTTMIYIIVTNRPYEETHGTTNKPHSPTNNVTLTPQPAVNGTKRFVEDIHLIAGNGSNPSPDIEPTNFSNPDMVPDPIPLPEPGSVPDSDVPEPAPTPGPSTIPPSLPPVPLPDDLWMKSIFLPVVDHLSLLKIETLSFANISGAYAPWMTKYPNLHVYLQFGNGTTAIKSSRKRFWGPDTIIGSYSAMVRLDNGKVTEIDWDDGCQECDADMCLDNVCALEPSACKDSMCDMKFYLAWIGTDANGIFCTSTGALPSNFRTFSFGKVYLQAAKARKNNALTIIDANN